MFNCCVLKLFNMPFAIFPNIENAELTRNLLDPENDGWSSKWSIDWVYIPNLPL
jgi:hypothetical protein